MSIYLDPGFYSNLFEVPIPFPSIDIPIMVIERSKYPDLRNLRDEIKENGKNIFVYAPERSKNLYGFGKDMEWLSNKGFRSNSINLNAEPHFTCYMILQAVIKKAEELGYQINFIEKGRWTLFNWKEFKTTSDNNVKLFFGYDIRTLFLKDPIEKRLIFMLVLDLKHALKDRNDNTLNYREITKKFGSPTLREIRQIQKDLIPTGINKEISRQRLIEDIIPFVEKISEITLPCNLNVKINTSPTRIVIGEEYETIW